MKAGHHQAATHAASPAIAVPVSFVACYAAWLKARRGKRPSANQLAFEARWLDRLLELKTALRAGRWQPARTVSFVVTHPKTREIHAPDFADRVVHHLLVERLEKLYEPIFIHDSYANRKGKGSHAAVDRLQQFMRGRNGQGWYLQLDIHNYFNSINRHVLYRMLCKRIGQCERRTEFCRVDKRSASTGRKSEKHMAGHPVDVLRLSTLPADAEINLPGAHALALRSLCHKLLANKVTERVRDPVAAALVPPHKRLANAAPGCGLPVGNLTSQFFANVYLNALDQFVKHTLKCRHYVRYVDDFVLLADDADQLRLWQAQIDEFLANTLALKCKEAAILQPLCQGVDFLGYRVFVDHRRVRPRVVAHCRAKLQDWAKRHVRTGIAIVPTLRRGYAVSAAPAARDAERPQKRSHGDRGNDANGFRRPGFIPTQSLSCRDESRPTENDALSHLQAMLGSYWGHFAHAQSVRLRHALFDQFDWLKTLFVLHPDGQLSPRWALQGVTFAGQVAAMKAEWPQARCLIQKGNRWLLLQPGRVGTELYPQGVGRGCKGIYPQQHTHCPRGNQTAWADDNPVCPPYGEQAFDERATQRLTASLRRQGIAYMVANQTGWLRHGTRRREVREWFSPNAVHLKIPFALSLSKGSG